MSNGQKSKTVCMIGYSGSIHFWRWSEFLKKADFNVVVISFIKNSFYKDYKKNILKYYDLSERNTNKFVRRILIFFNIFKAIKIINKSKFDLINFHFIEIYQCLIALFIKKRIILSCWGSDIFVNYKNSNILKMFLFQKLFKKAYKITADSETVRNTIIKRCRKIDKDKFSIVFWGIDEKIFKNPGKKEKEKLKKSFNITSGAVVILSIRNLAKFYGIKEIIIWFNRYIKDKNFYLFVRIPPKSDKKYINECKAFVRGDSRIIFNEEELNYKDINKLYKISDISLHYPKSDASPVSMLEAVSAGHIICAAPDICSYRTLAESYDNIKLVKLEDLSSRVFIKLLKNKKKIFLKYQHTRAASIEKLKEVMR